MEKRQEVPENWIAVGSVAAFVEAIAIQWLFRHPYPWLRPPHELVYDFVGLSAFAGLLTYVVIRWTSTLPASQAVTANRKTVISIAMPMTLTVVVLAFADDFVGTVVRWTQGIGFWGPVFLVWFALLFVPFFGGLGVLAWQAWTHEKLSKWTTLIPGVGWLSLASLTLSSLAVIHLLIAPNPKSVRALMVYLPLSAIGLTLLAIACSPRLRRWIRTHGLKAGKSTTGQARA